MSTKGITRDEYMSRLRRFRIENPTLEDMAAICPHLTPEQAVRAFTGVKVRAFTGVKEEGNYVACPPVLVKRGFQIFSFYKYPPALNWSYASRTLQSYKDGQKHGDVFLQYTYMEEAMAYGEQHWGDELVLDNWVDYCEIYVQDPSDLDNRDRPKTKAVVYFVINRDLNALINDHGKPESEQYDEAIVKATLNIFEARELKGGRGGYTLFNCAYCGEGLNLTCCPGCGHHFKDDRFLSGGSSPLPPKLVKLLRESGHAFHIDPSEAWKRERARQQR